ncbi:hypothetical protein ACTFIY_007947 [Dictyostelium cf. discoideum]
MNRIRSNSIESSTALSISNFIKYYWINIIIFVSILLILGLNLVSVIMETRDHFDITRLITLFDKEQWLLASTVSPLIKTINNRQRVSLLTNTFILVIDFVLFAFLCALILKRNLFTNKYSYNTYYNNDNIIKNDHERDRLIQPKQTNNFNISNNSNFNNNNNNNSIFSLTHQNNNSNNINNIGFERGSIFCESSLYEPWNEITIEKIAGSSDDIKPIDKIRNTYYRYGITAAKLIYDRVLFFLSPDEKREIFILFGMIDPQEKLI